MSLTDESKEELLRIARESISAAVRGGTIPDFTVSNEELNENRGAFVTIKIGGNLRGCIGYTLPVDSLYKVVSEVAQSAALHDPRFPALTENELEEIDIDISALTPLEKIEDISEIEVGKHGLFIERAGFKGLLLPQVATEYGWDRITFLEHTCRKAGLPKDAWKKPDTIIRIFSADVFGEKAPLS